MSQPDAFDEHGQPLYRQHCLTVCPAAHITEAREIAAWHCLNVENLVETTVESMLTTAVGPAGGGVTHYACYQSLFPKNIDLERATLTIKSARFPWVDGSDTPALPLETFCCLSRSLADFLAEHSLEVK